MTIDERMTICNMSIEGGARVGYVNPDDTTFAYLRGRPFAPAGAAFDRAVAWWRSLASDPGRRRTTTASSSTRRHRADRHLGHQPRDSRSRSASRFPTAEGADGDAIAEALAFMGLAPGAPIAGTRIDVAFIGSCTNGRVSDLEEAARVVRGHHVAPHVKAIVVPGFAGGRTRGRTARARTRSSAAPASNGAAPAARCASA